MAFQSRVGLFTCVPSVAIPHRQFACETADITPERRRDCTQLFERKIALSSFHQVAAGHKMAPAVGFGGSFPCCLSRLKLGCLGNQANSAFTRAELFQCSLLAILLALTEEF